jgi:hypothetical protein
MDAEFALTPCIVAVGGRPRKEQLLSLAHAALCREAVLFVLGVSELRKHPTAGRCVVSTHMLIPTTTSRDDVFCDSPIVHVCIGRTHVQG